LVCTGTAQNILHFSVQFPASWKTILTVDFVDEILKYDYSSEYYFLVVLFSTLKGIFLAIESMDEILKRGHSTCAYESY